MFKRDDHVSWPSLSASNAVAAPSYSVPTDPAATRVYPTSQRNPK